MAAKTSNEGVCLPMAKGRARAETLALTAAAPQACHLGVDVSLVKEDQAVWLLAHARLTLPCPEATLVTHIGACALRGHQLLFYR